MARRTGRREAGWTGHDAEARGARRRWCVRLAALLVLVLAVLAAPAGAAAAPCQGDANDVTWVGDSGSWHNGANWSTGAPPGSSQNACLLVLDVIVTHTSGTSTINSLKSQAELIVSGGALAIAAPSQVSGLFRLTPNATFTGAGDLTVAGFFRWTGGELSGTGTVHLLASAIVEIAGQQPKTLLTRTINNHGTIRWGGVGEIRAGSVGTGPGATINNQSGGVVEADTDADLRWSTGATPPTFTNAQGARLSKSPTSGQTVVEGTFNNHGLVEVGTGQLKLTGGGTHNGAFSVLPGLQGEGTLEFAGGTHTMSGASSIAGDGAVRFSGANATLAGSYAVGGTTFVTAGTATFNPPSPATTQTLSLSGGTLGGTGAFDVLPGGTSFWTGGELSGTGSTTIPDGATLVVVGSATKRLLSRTLMNAGMVRWEGLGNILAGSAGGGPAATIKNLDGGTFDAGTDQHLLPLLGAKPTFLNESGALFVKSGGQPLPNRQTLLFGRFVNHGTVEVQQGRLVLAGSLGPGEDTVQSDGAFVVQPDAELSLQGKTGLLPGASVAGGGTLAVHDRLLTPAGVSTAIAADVVLHDGAVLQPGSAAGTGQIAIVGDYTQRGGSQVVITVGGSAACTAFDRITVSGTATLSAAASDATRLVVSRTDGCNPSVGQPFAFLTFGARTGIFTRDTGVSPEFTVAYTPTTAALIGT